MLDDRSSTTSALNENGQFERRSVPEKDFLASFRDNSAFNLIRHVSSASALAKLDQDLEVAINCAEPSFLPYIRAITGIDLGELNTSHGLQ